MNVIPYFLIGKRICNILITIYFRVIFM